MLNMRRLERNETIPLEKVKDAHSKEFSNNANMIPIIKTILQMNAFSDMLVEFLRRLYFELFGSLRDNVERTRNSILKYIDL